MKEGLSTQEKIWIGGKAFLKALRPLMLYFLMPAACMAFGYVFFHLDMSAVEFFTYGGNFYTAVGMILTVVLLYRKSKKQGCGFFEDASLYLDGVNIRKAAAFFAFGLAVAVAVSAFLTLLPKWDVMTSYSEASQKMYKGRDILFTVITTVFMAPFLEEIVFRGYMLNVFLQTFEEKTAVILASVIFAVCHGQALWVLYALGMGLILAWVSLKENNIFYGIILHIGFNFSSAVNWLIQSIPAAEELFYGNRLLILGYGLIGACLAVLLARKYRQDLEKHQ